MRIESLESRELLANLAGEGGETGVLLGEGVPVSTDYTWSVAEVVMEGSLIAVASMGGTVIAGAATEAFGGKTVSLAMASGVLGFLGGRYLSNCQH